MSSHSSIAHFFQNKSYLISDMDRTSSRSEDTLHKHQHDKLAHMYDYHMAASFHTPKIKALIKRLKLHKKAV